MFTKEDTKVVKGVAILLMLLHHLIGFEARVPEGLAFVNLFPGEAVIADYLGSFGKLCVAMYMFLGGYGLYKQQEGQAFRLENNVVKLYKAYWKVFFIFVPIGFLFFSNQPVYCTEATICNVFSEFSLPVFLQNFMGTMSTYNREWWFFIVYLCTSFCGYLYIKNVKKRRGFWTELFFVILIMIFVYRIAPGFSSLEAFNSLTRDIYYVNFVDLQDPSVSFFMGIIFAKYDGITKLRKMIQEYSLVTKYVICVVGIVLIILVRKTIFGSYLDMFYLPCFIAFLLEIFENLKGARTGLTFLGKYSTNMWLIHGFYCYYFYAVAKIVYAPRIRVLSYIVFVILTLASAVLVDLFYEHIGKGIAVLNGKILKVDKEQEELPLELADDMTVNSLEEAAVTVQPEVEKIENETELSQPKGKVD